MPKTKPGNWAVHQVCWPLVAYNIILKPEITYWATSSSATDPYFYKLSLGAGQQISLEEGSKSSIFGRALGITFLEKLFHSQICAQNEMETGSSSAHQNCWFCMGEHSALTVPLPWLLPSFKPQEALGCQGKRSSHWAAIGGFQATPTNGQ